MTKKTLASTTYFCYNDCVLREHASHGGTRPKGGKEYENGQ